jgi:hypothetical protein
MPSTWPAHQQARVVLPGSGAGSARVAVPRPPASFRLAALDFMMMLPERRRKMSILLAVGALLALAFGLAIANDIRNRRSRRRRVQRSQIDAMKADSFIVDPHFFGKGGGAYFPPPDDGRPQH